MDSKHGVIVFHGDTKQIEFCEYTTRGMEQYIINCKDKPVEDINNELEQIVNKFSRDNYIKVILREITKLKQKQLDFKHVIKMKRESFYCKFSYEYDKSEVLDNNTKSTESSIKSIKEEFGSMLGTIVKDEKEKERILKLYSSKILKEA